MASLLNFPEAHPDFFKKIKPAPDVDLSRLPAEDSQEIKHPTIFIPKLAKFLVQEDLSEEEDCMSF